jgi:hypothetical protein
LVIACSTTTRGTPTLDCIPQFIVDDLEFWQVGFHPFGWRVGPTNPTTGVRVFNEALPVPNNTSHIQRVLQNAILPFPAAPNGRGVPVTTARGANPIAIKGAGYVAW